MGSISIIPLKVKSIIDWGENVFQSFQESVISENFKLDDGDIIVITSKIFSMQEKLRVKIADVEPSIQASNLAKESHLDPKIAQIVIDESSNEIYGAVYKAILAKTSHGLAANAGIDLSNSPAGYALLLPKNPDELAEKFRNEIRKTYKKEIGVLIIDSRTVPLRRGTMAVTLGLAGLEPVIDERGKSDLYGREMTITTIAVADNLATAANLVMGETDERIPFAVIRGTHVKRVETASIETAKMPEDQCLYFAPLLRLIEKEKINED